MSDYIDRQAAIEAVEFGITHTKAFRTDGTVAELFAATNKELTKAIDRLAQLPSVEVEPVKHGRWTPVTNGRGGFECSICHSYAPSYQDGVEWLSRYCPNCGAFMEIEEEA